MIKEMLALLTFTLVGVLFAVVLIEWAAGCGETYTDSTGARHHYDCAFVPFHARVIP